MLSITIRKRLSPKKTNSSCDHRCGMWRANVALALRDMKATRRNCDLIDWDIVNEFI